MRQARRRSQRGLTLVELIVAFTIMALLTTMAVPLARYKVRRDRERRAALALREIRKAIDDYKDAALAGKIEVKLGTDGYPETLDQLVDGVKLLQDRRWQEDQVSAADSAGSDDEFAGLGPAQRCRTIRSRTAGAGRTFLTCIARARTGSGWDAVCGVVRRVGTHGRGDARHGAGYTLIEMIIVMAIISILVAIAVPMYQKSILRTKESLLKNNLFTLRTVIDEYTFDKQKAPQTLQDLVDQGYLRGVPLDPITGTNQSWRVIMEDASILGGPDAARNLRCAQWIR